MPSSSSSSSAANVEESTGDSLFSQVTEYAKNPKYVMMFLAAIFMVGIVFMMYKKPEMLNKLLGKSNSVNMQQNQHQQMQEEEEDEQGQEL